MMVLGDRGQDDIKIAQAVKLLARPNGVPDSNPRFFGKFNSQREAEKWIAEHQWLTNHVWAEDCDVRRNFDPSRTYWDANPDASSEGNERINV